MNTFQIKIKIRKGSCRPQGSPQSPWAGPGCGGRGRVTALGRGFSVSARTCATAILFGDGATHRGLAATLLLFEAQTHTLRCAPVWPNLQSAPQRDPKWFQFSAVTGADQLFPVVRPGRCSDSSHARRGCPRRPGPKQGQGSRAPAGAPPYCQGAGLSAPRLTHRRHPRRLNYSVFQQPLSLLFCISTSLLRCRSAPRQNVRGDHVALHCLAEASRPKQLRPAPTADCRPQMSTASVRPALGVGGFTSPCPCSPHPPPTWRFV